MGDKKTNHKSAGKQFVPKQNPQSPPQCELYSRFFSFLSLLLSCSLCRRSLSRSLSLSRTLSRDRDLTRPTAPLSGDLDRDLLPLSHSRTGRSSRFLSGSAADARLSLVATGGGEGSRLAGAGGGRGGRGLLPPLPDGDPSASWLHIHKWGLGLESISRLHSKTLVFSQNQLACLGQCEKLGLNCSSYLKQKKIFAQKCKRWLKNPQPSVTTWAGMLQLQIPSDPCCSKVNTSLPPYNHWVNSSAGW